MKLLEFFGQINELRRRLFTRNNGAVYGFYGTKHARVPTHMLVSSDGSDLKYADDIYAVSLQSSSLSKFKREIEMKLLRGEDISDSDDTYLTMITLFSNLSLSAEHLRRLGKQLPTKKVVELNGRPRIFKYMTTDLGLPASSFIDVFGEEPPEMDEGDFVQFHNARLIVPDTMRPKNIKAATEALEAVYQHLDNAGEVEVFGGDIRFTKMSGSTAGLYTPETDTIAVNQNINLTNMSVLFTLLHEYAHKKMYTSMTPEAVAEVKKKFSELRRSGETHSEDIDYASAVHDAVSQFQPGQELTYVGRKRAFKEDPHYIIKTVDTSRMRAGIAHTSDPDRIFSDYPMQNLLNPKKWKADGVDLTSPQRKAQHHIKSDDWFPTAYSQTNYEEWWAEIYPIYILGNLGGEPADWMKGMLHGNTTTETVGGNDGEFNSESDPMPPPQHGDEEGNASWDWTDPYHSSGTENAVMSNTP